jgi:hypothetical protein
MQSPLKPEQKTEQRRETEGNGGLGGLAWVLTGLGKTTRFRGGNAPGTLPAKPAPSNDERQPRQSVQSAGYSVSPTGDWAE